jgi:hypothetical protein
MSADITRRAAVATAMAIPVAAALSTVVGREDARLVSLEAEIVVTRAESRRVLDQANEAHKALPEWVRDRPRVLLQDGKKPAGLTIWVAT